MNIPVLRPDEIERLRIACELAAETLVMVSGELTAGITTDDINRLVHEHTVAQGAWPAPLGYHGFPKSVCTSVNEVVCHGIPSNQRLKDGDIINVDVTTIYPPGKHGYYGDTSATFYVGSVHPGAREVVEVARHSLELGIEAVRPGGTVGDIGAVIQAYARKQRCSVVREYCGHGIGKVFHGEPSIPHYGRAGRGPRLKAGMAFTIEPMINLKRRQIRTLNDGWTVVTRDGSLSAQFEHTLVVTADGCDVLTRRQAPLLHSEDFDWARIGPRSCFIPAGTT